MNPDTISRAHIITAPVKSSQIAAIGYDSATSTLAIRFNPKASAQPGELGSLYYYSNVTPELFAQFEAAESVGSFFYKVIKPNPQQYPYVRIEPPVEQDKTERQEAA